jgi:hypothetical protein
LERARIDAEQEIPLLDIAALLEMNLVDESADAGADLDGFGGRKAAGEFIPFMDQLWDGVGDGNGGSGGGYGRDGVGFAATGRQESEGREEGDKGSERVHGPWRCRWASGERL